MAVLAANGTLTSPTCLHININLLRSSREMCNVMAVRERMMWLDDHFIPSWQFTTSLLSYHNITHDGCVIQYFSSHRHYVDDIYIDYSFCNADGCIKRRHITMEESDERESNHRRINCEYIYHH